MNNELIRDDEGKSLGNVGDYVERFKRLDGQSNNFTPHSGIYTVSRTSDLPAKWESSSEKKILVSYYRRLGNGSLQDFKIISNKIASSINRLYNQRLTSDIIQEKLNKIDEEDFEEDTKQKKTLSSTAKETPKEVKITIKEGNYKYLKGLKRLTPQELELCSFVPEPKLCFSSDDLGFFLTVKKGEEDSFDKLFKFTEKENLVYDMFRDQLGDDLKAKKLVLMSRILNDSSESDAKKPAQKTGKKKKLRKAKAKKRTPEMVSSFSHSLTGRSLPFNVMDEMDEKGN